MKEGRCISLIERLKQGSELKSTLSIGKLFQRFMTRSVKKVDLTELSHIHLRRRRTETTRQQRVGRCESHRLNVLLESGTTSIRACVRAGGGHFEHIL